MNDITGGRYMVESTAAKNQRALEYIMYRQKKLEMAEEEKRRQLSEHKKKPSLSKLTVKKWQCSRRDMEDRLKQIARIRDDESPEREQLRGGS